MTRASDASSARVTGERDSGRGILVVGLGNPGRRYESTRHNAGFWVLARLAERHGPVAWRERFQGRVGSVTIAGQKAVLLEPHTFMNESGRSVGPAAKFFEAEPSDIVVVHDEIDLPEGTIRLKLGGGDAGHRGLGSIRAHLQTGDFIRVRVGVGRPPESYEGDVADFVLHALPPAARAGFDPVVDRAAGAVSTVLERGLDAAINLIHQQH